MSLPWSTMLQACLHVQSSAVVELQRLTQNVLPCWSIFTEIQDALLTLHITEEMQKSEHPSPIERLHNAKSVLMPLKVDIVNILAYILYIGTCYDIPRLHTTKMLVISLEKKNSEMCHVSFQFSCATVDKWNTHEMREFLWCNVFFYPNNSALHIQLLIKHPNLSATWKATFQVLPYSS